MNRKELASRNTRTALILASVAAAFFLGFVLRRYLFA
ncbi:MAG TPA: cytochrome oxidase small assembly protein [Burkholderiales bacterium]|nr:cytochrome oxidase small assembly protein [Burkholderiales bacterium]